MNFNSNNPNHNPYMTTNYGYSYYSQQQHQQKQSSQPMYPTNTTSSQPPPVYPYDTHSYQPQIQHLVPSAAASHFHGLYYSHSYPYNGMVPTQNSVMIPPPPPPPKASPVKFNSNIQTKDKCSNIFNTDSYYCDSCEISFSTASAFMSHKSSHIKCTKCEFTASKKVVSAHFQSAHGKFAGRGLKTVKIQIPGSKYNQQFQICVGNHPDDIQAWIEERRRKFPTRANIASKEEKRKRLRDDPTCRLKDQKKMKLDADGVSKGKCNETSKPTGSVALASLMEGYDSTSDEENNNDVIIQRTSTNGTSRNQIDSIGNVESNYKTKQCKFFIRNGTCKNGEDCNYIHDIIKHEEFKSNIDIRKRNQSERDRARNASKKEIELLTTGRVQNGKKSEGNSLLRKLLHNDIRRERTICLQLLRYIVDCNYLQANRESKDETRK